MLEFIISKTKHIILNYLFTVYLPRYIFILPIFTFLNVHFDDIRF